MKDYQYLFILSAIYGVWADVHKSARWALVLNVFCIVLALLGGLAMFWEE